MARVYPKSQTNQVNKKSDRRGRRRRFWLGPRSCLGQFMFVLILIALGLGIAVARTGLVTIPILTPLFYHPVEPTRKIQLNRAELHNIGPTLSEILEQYRSEGRLDLPLSEENLTKLLQVALVEREQPTLQDIQAVIEPDGIEVSGQLHSRRYPYHFDMTVWPTVKKGKITFSVRRAHLERVPLPASLGNAIVHNYLAASENTVNRAMSQYLEVSNIQLSSRTAIITGRVLQSRLPF